MVRLRRFRRASTLAVALTGSVLLLAAGRQQSTLASAQDSPAVPSIADSAAAVPQDSSTTERVQQAARPIRDLARTSYRALPRLAIAIALFLAATVLSRGARWVLRRILRGWQRADALAALLGIGIWILAGGAAVSVVAGDFRALVGAVGLFGLALSWSLQTPIESFTGWLLNSFQGYYSVGDRIAVGDVFGDVYAIDVLTTTVWEAGGADKSVSAAQPTGALITFPNSEVLRANIINYTRDFPYVWDEVTVGIANESDLPYARHVFRETAVRIVGPAMAAPAESYRALLRAQSLDYEVAVEPQVYVTPRDAWTDLTVRYLVPARERRTWATDLTLALVEASAQREHGKRIIGAYPRQQIELVQTAPP
jgi:small-conductance mechanosensitive channel